MKVKHWKILIFLILKCLSKHDAESIKENIDQFELIKITRFSMARKIKSKKLRTSVF